MVKKIKTKHNDKLPLEEGLLIYHPVHTSLTEVVSNVKRGVVVLRELIVNQDRLCVEGGIIEEQLP